MKKSEDRVLDKKTKNRMLRSVDIDKNDIPKVVNEYFSYINFDNHLKGTQELKTIIVHCFTNNIVTFKLNQIYLEIKDEVHNSIVNIEKNIRMALCTFALNSLDDVMELYKDMISADESKVTAKKFILQTLKILRELVED